MKVKGTNGTVIFDGATVMIQRTGFNARVMIGSGTKAIPVQREQRLPVVGESPEPWEARRLMRWSSPNNHG